MTDREKLIALLCEVQYLGGLEEKIADHLLANGVVVREKGGWKLTVDGHGNAHLTCNKCNEEMCLSEDNGEEMPRFCPWCGRDMRKEG